MNITNQPNRILTIKAKKRCCCYSVSQMCALSVHNKKMILGVSKTVDIILKHFYWFKNQVTSTRAMSDRKFSRLDHNNNIGKIRAMQNELSVRIEMLTFNR